MEKGPKSPGQPMQCSEIFSKAAGTGPLKTIHPAAFLELPRQHDCYTTKPGSSRTEYDLDFLDTDGQSFTLTIKGNSVNHVKEITERLRNILRDGA